MLFTRNLSALAAATLCSIVPALASAVELGDLKITSGPGEPLEALLEVNDVDITMSPLLVRVAPPATYLREGINWPREAQDLKMARVGDDSGTVKVRVVGAQSLTEGFPLLIEMNAGGKVTVRTYELERDGSTFRVVAHPEEPAALPKVESSVQTASTEPKSAPRVLDRGSVQGSERTGRVDRRLLSKSGRFAPDVVREYVAVNGFNPEAPFAVQRDMTLWSISQLYWSTYPGALLEQVAVALTQKNPETFVKGDPSRIVAGQRLLAPSSDEVFSIDPLEAFRAVHGASMEVPAPTQNLIDAQRRSREAAGETAAAQMAAKSRGEGADGVIDAGKKALAAWEANHPEATGAAEAGPRDAQQSASHADEALAEPQEESGEVDQSAQTAEVLDPAASQEDSQPEAAAPDESTNSPEAAPQHEQSAADAAPEAQQNENAGAAQNSQEVQEKRPLISYVLILVGIAILASIAWRKRKAQKEKDAQAAAQEAKRQGVVAFERDVARATDAQLKAVDATVEEAIKNGTTAGAMGAGSIAYAQAQMSESAKTAPQEGPAAASAPQEGAAVQTSEPQAAQKASGAEEKARQPWLDADDKELPPLSEEEIESANTASRSGSEKMMSDLKRIDLRLDEEKLEKTEAPSDGYIPPLAPEPIPQTENAQIASASSPAEKELELAQPQEPLRHPNAKERARLEAIDAKLSLAKAFINIGAKKEARELLNEVKKEGDEAQRAAAQQLLNDSAL